MRKRSCREKVKGEEGEFLEAHKGKGKTQKTNSRQTCAGEEEQRAERVKKTGEKGLSGEIPYVRDGENRNKR